MARLGLPFLLGVWLYLLYAPGFFLLDDFSLLGNPAFRSLDGWWRLLADWKRTRPVTDLSFWLSFQLAGVNPAGWLAMNLAIAAVGALALWRLFARLGFGTATGSEATGSEATGSDTTGSSRIPWPLPLLLPLLLLLHPVALATWHYTFARATLLVTVALLLALEAWLAGRFGRALAFGALALLCKEDAVVLPLLFLVLTLAEHGRKVPRAARGAILLMAALALVAGLRTIAATKAIAGSGAGFGSSVSPSGYALAQGKALWLYLFAAVSGWGVAIDPPPVTADSLGLVGWFALFALALLLVWRLLPDERRNGRTGPAPLTHPALWLLLGLSVLLPSSSLLPADDLLAYRRLYPALALWAIAFACWWGTTSATSVQPAAVPASQPKPFPPAWRQRISYLAVASQLFALLSLFPRWQSAETLWQSETQGNPESLRPRLQLARAQAPTAALTTLAEAGKKWPAEPRIASERGRVFLELGQPAEALREFGRALALQPNDPLALTNRGSALLLLGQTEAAIADLQQALRQQPCLESARQNLRQAAGEQALPKVTCP